MMKLNYDKATGLCTMTADYTPFGDLIFTVKSASINEDPPQLHKPGLTKRVIEHHLLVQDLLPQLQLAMQTWIGEVSKLADKALHGEVSIESNVQDNPALDE